MTSGGETADQMTRMTLQGIEVAANVVLKVGGSASKSLAATLYAILMDKRKVRGKTRLNNLLKSGKELKVFAIRHKDLKIFCNEAKQYGVLYSVLKEKNNTDGICDIMVRAEDAAKISRIIDKFELATIDTKTIRESIEKEHLDNIKNVPILNDKEHDELVHSLMASTKNKNTLNNTNPSKARTKKMSDNLSERFSNQKQDDNSRPSVRAKLNKIKEEQKLNKHHVQKSKKKAKYKYSKKLKER